MDRATQFERQLPEVMSGWEKALRSGYSVKQCVEATAQITQTRRPFDPTQECNSVEIMETIACDDVEPAKSEFAQLLADWLADGDFFAAMDKMRARVPSPSLDLFVTSLRVQREVGGNLADLLEATSMVLRKKVANGG